MHINYMEILGRKYPAVQASLIGDPTVYENIQVEEGSAPLPSKEELDATHDKVLKDDIWEKIKVYRDIRKFSGTRVGDNWFHSDDSSRIQQVALVIFGANMPPNIMWKTMQGTFVPMTPTLAGAIFQSTALNDNADYKTAEQHRVAMNASSTPEDYDYTTGWLQRFDEWAALNPTLIVPN